MQGLVKVNDDGVVVVSSRDVAEKFGKEHNDLKKKIRTLSLDMGEISHIYFLTHKYKDLAGRTQEEYIVTRDGFSLLVMGFTGKKALEWKLKYIEAFNKMEEIIKNTTNTSIDYLRVNLLMELAKTTTDDVLKNKALHDVYSMITNTGSKPTVNHIGGAVKNIDESESIRDYISKYNPVNKSKVRAYNEYKNLYKSVLSRNEFSMIMKKFGYIGKQVRITGSSDREYIYTYIK